jgi:hypothetical protein
MFAKRWILIGVINVLLLSSAFQLFVGNKSAAQAHAYNTTNLDDSPSGSLFLPLVMRDNPFIPTPTMTFTPTFTPSPSPSPSRTPSMTPTATFTQTPSPTYNGTPPSICETHDLPNKTESFSDSTGPVKHVLPTPMQHTMRVKIVTASADLKGLNCTIGQLVMVKGIQQGSWNHYSNNSYAIYTDSAYTSFDTNVGDSIEYRAFALPFNCSGSITGATNYVKICGDPIP